MSHPPIVPGSKHFEKYSSGWHLALPIDIWSHAHQRVIKTKKLITINDLAMRPVIAAVAAQEWRDEANRIGPTNTADYADAMRNADAWISWRDEQAAHE